jgi:C4-dicarboxylate-specific signal transduction histidine kinase
MGLEGAARHYARLSTRLEQLGATEHERGEVGRAPLERLCHRLPRVWIDPVQLRQLLVALVLNAVNSIDRERRGRVHIRTGAVRADHLLLLRAPRHETMRESPPRYRGGR